MANNNGMPKKSNSGITLAIYGVIAVIAMVAGCILGYAIDLTLDEDERIDIMAAFNMTETVLNEPKDAFVAALNNGDGYARKGAIVGGLIVLIYYAYTSTTKKRYHRKGVEHGSARWGTDNDKRVLQDKNDLYNNIIYADDIYLVLDRKKRDINAGKKPPKKKKQKNSPVGNKTISEVAETNKKIAIVNSSAKVKKIQPMLNLNAIVIGGSGTGKSRFFVKPNLLLCNTSFVVTDPAGELLQSTGKMLERNGYKIKVFNLMNMEHSSNYNPFHYLYDYDGSYNSNNVIKMINTFMINTTKEGGSADPFWDDATKLLLSAVCFLIIETGDEDEQNFAMVLDLIRKAQVIEGKEDEKSELDLIFDQRKEANPKALSVQYYDEFKQAAGKTMQSILISTTTKLQYFKLPSVRNLTHKDNIHLETLGDEKTALFIIIPSTDKTYNFLAAMMYMQLFDTLFDRAIQKFGGRLPVHVRFILDEFANVGKIPEFETVLATMRKFEISATVILQNLAQLKRLYEKSWEELPGNCDTMLYLGGKDQSTNEYISKELGKETIDTLAINKTKARQGSTSYNDGILGRELMLPDELSQMDNSECIVMVRGMPPFRTLKYRLEKHPRYAELYEGKETKHNEFPLDSIQTEKEIELLDVSYVAENEDYTEFDYDSVSSVNIKYVDGDNAPYIAEDIEISDAVKEQFSNVVGVYCSQIT